jgi:tRNA pseudouridine38-40 synthase
VPNIKLVVEYDGSGFHGWQKQGELRTVQTELGRVLSLVLRSQIYPLHAAGRTDAGVHARGQVVTFKVSEVPDLWRLAQSVSHLLKGELAVLSAEVVDDSFHPGKSATHKQYTYSILNRPSPAVLDARRVWHVHRRLDISLMQKCAQEVIGEHDFSTFRDSECCARSPIKTIYECISFCLTTLCWPFKFCLTPEFCCTPIFACPPTFAPAPVLLITRRIESLI